MGASRLSATGWTAHRRRHLPGPVNDRHRPVAAIRPDLDGVLEALDCGAAFFFALHDSPSNTLIAGAATRLSMMLSGFRPILALLLAAFVAIAGCVAPPQEGAKNDPATNETTKATPPEDPDPPQDDGPKERARYAKQVGGTDRQTHTIPIPSGTATLKITASYQVGGTATFSLANPLLLEEKRDDVTGGTNYGPATWYTVTDPMEGNWELTLAANGGVQYDFAVFY